MDTVLTLITVVGHLLPPVPVRTCDAPILQKGLLTCLSASGPQCLLPFLVARSPCVLQALRLRLNHKVRKWLACQIPFPPLVPSGSWDWVHMDFKTPTQLLISIFTEVFRAISGQQCLSYSIFIFKSAELLLNCQSFHCIPEILECVHVIEC